VRNIINDFSQLWLVSRRTLGRLSINASNLVTIAVRSGVHNGTITLYDRPVTKVNAATQNVCMAASIHSYDVLNSKPIV